MKLFWILLPDYISCLHLEKSNRMSYEKRAELSKTMSCPDSGCCSNPDVRTVDRQISLAPCVPSLVSRDCCSGALFALVPPPVQGDTGATGATGPQGSEGPVGPRGPTGQTGPIGIVGEQGPIGDQGNTGIDGLQGPQGATGPIGNQGPVGNPGPQGTVGDQGPIGPTGGQGSTGPDGNQGPPGNASFTGYTGFTGPQGPTGTIGNPGPDGNVGDQGPTGNTGIDGFQGPTGMTGIVGPDGADGATGDQGNTGFTGPTGPIGPLAAPTYVWYVATNGVDAPPNNGSEWAPFATLQYAVSQATAVSTTANHVIQFAPGTYDWPAGSGVPTGPFQITNGNISLIAEDSSYGATGTSGATVIQFDVEYAPTNTNTFATVSGITFNLNASQSGPLFNFASTSTTSTLRFVDCSFTNIFENSDLTHSAFVNNGGIVSFERCSFLTGDSADALTPSTPLVYITGSGSVEYIRNSQFSALLSQSAAGTGARTCLLMDTGSTVEEISNSTFTNEGDNTSNPVIDIAGSSSVSITTMENCSIRYSGHGIRIGGATYVQSILGCTFTVSPTTASSGSLSAVYVNSTASPSAITLMSGCDVAYVDFGLNIVTGTVGTVDQSKFSTSSANSVTTPTDAGINIGVATLNTVRNCDFQYATNGLVSKGTGTGSNGATIGTIFGTNFNNVTASSTSVDNSIHFNYTSCNSVQNCTITYGFKGVLLASNSSIELLSSSSFTANYTSSANNDTAIDVSTSSITNMSNCTVNSRSFGIATDGTVANPSLITSIDSCTFVFSGTNGPIAIRPASNGTVESITNCSFSAATSTTYGLCIEIFPTVSGEPSTIGLIERCVLNSPSGPCISIYQAGQLFKLLNCTLISGGGNQAISIINTSPSPLTTIGVIANNNFQSSEGIFLDLNLETNTANSPFGTFIFGNTFQYTGAYSVTYQNAIQLVSITSGSTCNFFLWNNTFNTPNPMVPVLYDAVTGATTNFYSELYQLTGGNIATNNQTVSTALPQAGGSGGTINANPAIANDVGPWSF